MTTKTPHKKGVTIGMTPTQDKPQVPTAEPVKEAKLLPIPSAFQSADPSLKPEQLQFAVELGAKFPGIVEQAEALKLEYTKATEALGRVGQKYYGTCNELRKAKLNRRESTLLLKGLGFSKSRVSEMLKVSEVSDELWAKFANQQIGFKATLALSNGAETPTDGDGGDAEGDGEGEKKKVKAKERRLPKEFQPSIIAALEDWGDSLKATGQKDPYVLRYENKDKRTYVVTIQPIEPSAS